MSSLNVTAVPAPRASAPRGRSRAAVVKFTGPQERPGDALIVADGAVSERELVTLGFLRRTTAHLNNDKE